MKRRKAKNIVGKISFVVVGAAFTVVGFVLLPPLIQKYSNKLYKASLKREVIDFDNMGPDIVPHDTKEEE